MTLSESDMALPEDHGIIAPSEPERNGGEVGLIQ
jgi:hypothetical protein